MFFNSLNILISIVRANRFKDVNENSLVILKQIFTFVLYTQNIVIAPIEIDNYLPSFIQ